MGDTLGRRNPDMRHSGFLILLKPQLAFSRYEATEFARDNSEVLGRLRRTLAFLDPSSYRGISRDPLWPVFMDLKSETAFGELAARTRFREIVGPHDVAITDEDVLSSLDNAIEIFALLEKQ